VTRVSRAASDVSSPTTARVARESFGALDDGHEVELFTLTSASGIEMRVMTYGGIIVSLRVPDRDGRLDDVVLGFDDAESYRCNTPYFGAIVGRYGNRIARGQFELDGERHQLTINNGRNHLHGGRRGFDKHFWVGAADEPGMHASLALTHISAAGDQGYPGTLAAMVKYTLTANELVIDYAANTDAPTIVNLTQHTYFNLSGGRRDDILDHVLTIPADRFTPVDEEFIPTGMLTDVEGTPFDFRAPVAIGARIDAPDEQFRRAGGYDHNFVLSRNGDGLRLAADVLEPETGRRLTVFTTQPGVQFYSGNFLDGSIRGKGGRVYGRHSGFCLETQHFPDAPNHPSFPSTVIRPGQPYRSRTVFRFGTAKEPYRS
jgi:aldose 1-epimerase